MSNFFFALLLCVSSLSALNFYSYEDALKLQKTNGKTIMVDVMRSDCHYCAKMEEETLNDAEMSAWLESRFIPVEINLDFDELPRGLNVFVTPTFFFLDTSHKVTKKLAGYWSKEDFKELTKDIK